MFKLGNFRLEDDDCSGGPSHVKQILLKYSVTRNPHYTVHELLHRLNIPKRTPHDHLKKIWCVKRYNVWVPKTLISKNMLARIIACDSFQKKIRQLFFIKRISTGDEKLILYNNVIVISCDKSNEPLQVTSREGLRP